VKAEVSDVVQNPEQARSVVVEAVVSWRRYETIVLTADFIVPDNHPRIVDASWIGKRAQWIVDGCVMAVVVDEAVIAAAAVAVIPDDLPFVVDALGDGLRS
jgi:hypothetical protein